VGWNWATSVSSWKEAEFQADSSPFHTLLGVELSTEADE